ncbi:hypothetical protein [Maribacter ulvicola]|uniref:Uncharacterized protein n=1 Tax=Maribacter ulvicola TaxID=228959 RepID=A0A1N6YJJ8_9FLAO|nr:hypothetical protein [Maribacter ulvicola]SIR14730.1 hypothetical protein SAMN05421797_10718 [Maribacter ulvicola]
MDEQILNIIIAVIIIIQVIVFIINMTRIFAYKQSIGNIQNYKIKDAFVPEKYMNSITVREILTDNIPESYMQPVPENVEYVTDEEKEYYDPNSEQSLGGQEDEIL